MGYQSKTYSLSEEVVAVIDAAKAKGESPNKFLRRLMGLNFGCSTCGTASIGVIQGIPVFPCKHENSRSKIGESADKE